MVIPVPVRTCLDTLEQAGFPSYIVGGCVRDALLGLTPHDYDICTAALPDETQALFSSFPLGLEGKQHGTIVVHVAGEPIEITTFRSEGPYSDNRHPDWVEFVGDVEKDLARRDFTVNAMAWSPTRGLADPFGGKGDLEKKLLRTVGEPDRRFREDALRILRGMRFSARFGLVPEKKTGAAMASLASLTEALSRERVFEELSGFLRFAGFADLIRFAPVLGTVIPELAPMVGFDQRSPHHAYDLYTHTAHVTAGVNGDLTIRWAALLHDTGKVPCFTRDETGRGHFYGHAPAGGKIAEEILTRLRAPADLRQEVVFLIENHMLSLAPDKVFLRKALSKQGWARVSDLLALQIADFQAKGKGEEGPDFDRIDDLLAEIAEENPCLSLKELAVTGHDLTALGITGKAVGRTLSELLEAVLEDRVANERDALLSLALEITPH